MKKWLGVLMALSIAGVLVGLVIVPALGQDKEDEQVVRTYDEDEDGVLSRQEALNVIRDFFNGQATWEQAVFAATLVQLGGDFDRFADYGDAPDNGPTGYPAPVFAATGSFPSLFASNGARTISTDEAVLGLTASEEFDANVINLDDDDAIGNFFINVMGIPPAGELFVNVTAPETSPGGDFYLNVLTDLNMDGVWSGTAAGGEPEWVVQNFLVNVIPGTTIMVHPPAFAYSNGNRLPDGNWTRIALTRETVDSDNWDGSGEFSSGEIEDHVIALPDTKILRLTCPSPYIVPPPPAPDPLPCPCTIRNYGSKGGTVNYVATSPQLNPGVMINPAVGPIPPWPMVIGPAGAPNDTVPFALNAWDNPGGDLPCSWNIQLTTDPFCTVFPWGVEAGVSETTAEIEFLGQPDPPTIALDGGLDWIDFNHGHTCTGFCDEEFVGEFEITNVGGGTLDWWVDPLASVNGDSWLHVNPTNGTAPTTVTLTFQCWNTFGVGGFIGFSIHGQDPGTGFWATNSNDIGTTTEWFFE